MERDDWLLLFLALKGSPQGVDPVRIQKGMFLFAKESGRPEEETYIFRPYHYGPMASRIYQDVDDLERRGLVEGVPQPGYSWQRYKITPRGRAEARERLVGATQEERAAFQKLFEIKEEVTSRSFRDLLRHVYGRYPDYARNSVFNQ